MSGSTPSTPNPAPVDSVKHPARSGKSRTSVAQFLCALIVLLVSAPFVDQLELGRSIDAVLVTLVSILGVLAVGRNHRTLVLALVLVFPVVLARWIHHFQPQIMPPAFQHIASLVFLVFLEFQLLHFIFRAPKVNSEVLCAGISGYLLLGILWTVAYMLVSGPYFDPAHTAFANNVGSVPPHALTQFEAYYFSFITLSTVGYGDITPMSHPARSLAMMEAMVGTLYLAVLISRLVSLYSAQGSEVAEKKD